MAMVQTEIVGLPAWAWTLIWFGAGILLGALTVMLFNCWWRREVQATRCPYPPSRAYLASRQVCTRASPVSPRSHREHKRSVLIPIWSLQLQSSLGSPGATEHLGLSKSQGLKTEHFTGSIAGAPSSRSQIIKSSVDSGTAILYSLAHAMEATQPAFLPGLCTKASQLHDASSLSLERTCTY